MPYGTVLADTFGTSVPGASLGAGNASIMKNRLINGSMTVDQRNAGASVTPTLDGSYTLDRWGVGLTAASKFSVQQNAGSVTPPVGFTNYLGVTSLAATSLGATDYYIFYQKIEGFNFADLGFGTANAKTVTLSFQVRSSLTGTFGGSLANESQNRNYPFSYSIPVANTWTTISVTIAGDTTGTWTGATNGLGAILRIGLGVGSTWSGTAGAWTGSSYIFAPTGATSVVGTNGATFYITGVQLEVGSSATGFEYVNYQTSLANCQRYCLKYGGEKVFEGMAYGVADATTEATVVIFPPVFMRTIPSVSGSTLALADQTSAQTTVTAVSIDGSQSTSKFLSVIATVASGLTTYRTYFLRAANSTSAYLILSAEL
jgi:hypothetical protein